MIIKIDYDQTIDNAKYPAVGQPVPGAIESIKLLKLNNTIILDTCRHGDSLTAAIEYLKTQGILFDHVCENHPGLMFMYGDPRKISADISIDDKNLFTPLDEYGCVIWDKVMDILFY